jgi:hypothetical protein
VYPGGLAPDLFWERVSSDTKMEYPGGDEETCHKSGPRSIKEEALVCLTEFLINPILLLSSQGRK